MAVLAPLLFLHGRPLTLLPSAPPPAHSSRCLVAQTQDHGTFNSWDRQPFFVAREGFPDGTYVPLSTEIVGNFWMNDYNSQEAVDNDDDSCYYDTHHNFFPFSRGGLKNDFGGHDNHHHSNMYINSGNCMSVCPQLPGHEDSFFNNTCVLFASNPAYASYDTKYAHPIMHDNRVFTIGAQAWPCPRSTSSSSTNPAPFHRAHTLSLAHSLLTHSDGKAKETGGDSISAVQAQGFDLGTTVAAIPGDSEIVAMARALLQM